MTPRFDDVNARARGLRTHLLTRRDLEHLAQTSDLPALAHGLRAAGFPIADADRAAPAALELAVRRHAASQLAILARWCGPREVAIAILYDDLDRTNLRAILRGAAEGADAAQRLAATIPTPALPERALAELARQPSIQAITALLSAWRHAAGPALAAAVGAGETDLLRVELALNGYYLAHALRLARGGALAAFVRQTIDVENTLAALVLAERSQDLTPKDTFVPGGQHIGVADFEEAVAAGAATAAARLARAFNESPLADALRRHAGDSAAIEAALLRARLAEQRRAERRDPLSPAPLLSFVLGLQAQTADVRSLIWGLTLEAPRSLLAAGLVTVV